MNFNYLDYLPTQEKYLPWGYALTLFICLWIIFKIARYRLVRGFTFSTKKVTQLWGKSLVDQKVVEKLVYAFPILVFMIGVKFIQGLPEIFHVGVTRFCLSVILILILRAVTKFSDNFNDAYSELEISNNRPIKGFIQIFLILVHLLVIILVISILLDKSPWVFVSGLGAMTAVLLLVFRDTLLSLVAGLQITANNYVIVGDWIELPQFNANGVVVDIALHAVRVQNWDKTITVIPTHKFLEHSFLNWRNMEESGGRRIQRSVHLDVNTVNFLTLEQTKSFKRFDLIGDYIDQAVSELEQQKEKKVENSKRPTNIGVFRAYVANYLRQSSHIRHDMTFVVRQLPSSPEGVPIEIYVFANETRWAFYEKIQSDIFDHILAIVPEFGLKVYQKPAGTDVTSLKS